jgi:hypothetical protein
MYIDGGGGEGVVLANPKSKSMNDAKYFMTLALKIICTYISPRTTYTYCILCGSSLNTADCALANRLFLVGYQRLIIK